MRQLFKNNGHLFNYCECINYYKIPVTGKKLTSCLIQLLSGNISSESVPLYTNQLSINGVRIIDNKLNNFHISCIRDMERLHKTLI